INRAPPDARHRGRVLPYATAIRGVKTSQLAIAIDAIDVPVLKNRRGNDRVQRLCILLIAAGDLPDPFNLRLVLQEPQQQRSIIKRSKEDPLLFHHGRGDADGHVPRRPFIAPQDHSGWRGEPGDAVADPAQDHRLTRLMNENWSAVLAAVA